MPNPNDVTLSAEEIQLLKDVQCNFYGENPSAHQETILQYFEEQYLVERISHNNRTHWKLTPDGTKALHHANAKEEAEKRNRRHMWTITIFSVLGAGVFVLIAALL